jgi:hypothetical protein
MPELNERLTKTYGELHSSSSRISLNPSGVKLHLAICFAASSALSATLGARVDKRPQIISWNSQFYGQERQLVNNEAFSPSISGKSAASSL